VAARRFHATQLHDLTGLEVGEGQARILLADMRAFQAQLQQQTKSCVSDAVAALQWHDTVFRPGLARAHHAAGGIGDPVQAYCDMVEVRWLLSDQAGQDVGDAPALEALSRRTVPPESAAKMAIADASTGQLPALTPQMLYDIALDAVEAEQDGPRPSTVD
jgi:hypothetical protein